MSCEGTCGIATTAIAIVIASTMACVQSSGIDPPPPGDAVAVVDGEEVPVKAVNAYRADEEEYGPGRRVLVSAVVGVVAVQVQFGVLSPGAQEVLPFNIPEVGGTTGAESETPYVGVSGSVEVIEGDGEVGPFAIKLTDVVLQQTCSGERITIERATLRGDLVINTELLASDVYDLPALGFVGANVDHPTDGSIPFVGIAETRAQTLTSGAEVLRVDAFDSCVGRNRVFTFLIHPNEVVGGELPLTSSNDTLVFFRETAGNGSTTIVEDSVAIAGVIELDDPIDLAVDGNVAAGRMRDLDLANVVENDIREDEPRATTALLEFRTVMEAP